MRKTAHKYDRVGSEIRKELSEIISYEIKDPRISGMTSVTDVEVTPDLKYCKVFISVLGDEDAEKSTIEGLRSAAGFIRKKLAASVNLRNTPELNFVSDTSIRYGIEMSKRIDEVLGKEEEAKRESTDQKD